MRQQARAASTTIRTLIFAATLAAGTAGVAAAQTVPAPAAVAPPPEVGAVQPLRYIAGLAPDRRPAAVPHIVAVRKSSAWYERALHGISKPYPPSLQFLDDVGMWHFFFGNPGMPGPYDIRGWHSADTDRLGR